MGDRTKLCDYTNTPNDQFIAKPITMVGMNSINIAESVPSTLEGTLNELLEYPEYLLPFMSQLVGLKEEVNETKNDESLILVMLEKKLRKLKCLVKLRNHLLI